MLFLSFLYHIKKYMSSILKNLFIFFHILFLFIHIHILICRKMSIQLFPNLWHNYFNSIN